MKKVALAKVRDELPRYLRLAQHGEVIITHEGKAAGVLIGFESEEDWLDYRVENHPDFLTRVASARTALRAGLGVPLEDAAKDADTV